MPRRRSSLTRVGVVAPRRTTTWIAGLDNGAATTLAANNGILLATLNAAALAARPYTVIRVRGLLSVKSDQVAADEEGHMAFGMAVVSDQAAGIGVTAVPLPISDQGSDLFFLYQLGGWNLTFVTGVGLGADWSQFEFDSKAMRKVNDDQDIAVTVENESAAAGCIFKLSWRMLLKLH